MWTGLCTLDLRSWRSFFDRRNWYSLLRLFNARSFRSFGAPWSFRSLHVRGIEHVDDLRHLDRGELLVAQGGELTEKAGLGLADSLGSDVNQAHLGRAQRGNILHSDPLHGFCDLLAGGWDLLLHHCDV